jgi:NADP-dependent 3-hydroxy acid dehydrogenase YdfG
VRSALYFDRAGALTRNADCATKAAVRSFTGSLLRELVSTPIRVSEIQPGAVETEFSVVRFRGDKKAADAVYEGIEPLTGDDIAEEVVWIASRPAHVNVAELFIMPVSQARCALRESARLGRTQHYHAVRVSCIARSD